MDSEFRRTHNAAAVLFAFVTLAVGPALAQLNKAPTSPQRALIDQYCVTCHNQRLRTAGLLLDAAAVDDVAGSAAIWEKVLRKIRTGAMPPPSMPRPDKTASDAFASWLEASLDRSSAAHPNPGRVAVHRLN